MTVNHVKISSVTNFLEYVYEMTSVDGVRCYRGHSDKSWKIQPSVLRDYLPDTESEAISELMQEVPEEFSSDKTMLNKLVRAQHYGTPTRLLDVTLNPLVSLYFACQNANRRSKMLEKKDADGHVIIMDIARRRIKNANSDTVSIICNLAFLKDFEKDILKSAVQKQHNSHEDSAKYFAELEITEKLIHFIKMEKPYFLNKIRPNDLTQYLFVYPEKTNRRIIAQSGAFVLAGLLEFKRPETSKGIKTTKIIIPKAEKQQILKHLDMLNVNSRSLFPEIEKASEYIKTKWAKPV